MDDSKFNVLLYSDELQSAFFAVAYSAILLMNMPNMHLTVVHLKESKDGPLESEKVQVDSWPISSASDWMKNIMGGSDSAVDKDKYNEIITKTNEILSMRVLDVSHQVLYCNPSIPDTVDALLECAAKKSIELIVMGTEEFTTLKGLIFGSLGYAVQKRSLIPVLLVKKLPQDALDSYRLKSTLKIIRK